MNSRNAPRIMGTWNTGCSTYRLVRTKDYEDGDIVLEQCEKDALGDPKWVECARDQIPHHKIVSGPSVLQHLYNVLKEKK